MKRGVLFLLLIVFKLGSAQSPLLDSLSLDTMKGYSDLGLAKANPDKVLKLVLTKKKLTTFPEEIRQFKNIQYLDLSKNKLSSVPSWISELSSLQTLILSHNDIDSLEPQIGMLKHLKWFIMNRDPLDAIPDAIGGLTELRYLDMWGDDIAYFPAALSKLTNLKEFDLRDILINQETQTTIQSYLPKTTIFFSPACSCKN
ncbi:MAG TPA: leucine-rich repeat domain-containing protein [Bacteroidia bacterium]|jgi:Leucine-rich repeat (LRR) protein|nr:leucine-rich repeat domain-containing protein [Bacteroidia bacterium]